MAADAWSRREFCGAAAALLLVSRAAGQVPGGTATRPDVAAIDHDRILAEAQKYLMVAPTPITSLPCVRSPGTAHDYYSEAEGGAGAAFTAHRDAMFALGLQVPALAAAHLLTGDAKFAEHGALQLRAWFVDAGTRMTPRMDYAQVSATPVKAQVTVRTNSAIGVAAEVGGSYEGILETLPLVEIVQALPFLGASLTEADLGAIHAWFAEYLRWLTAEQDSGPRLAALARDRKDHHGTSWMLQVSAYSLLTAPETGEPKSEDASMVDLRHRFKTVTLRAQISRDGTFPHELTTDAPYRNSLFNLDMIALLCDLLSTRFENVWEYQLDDGPGMRGAIAYHFAFIADRARWPFRADNAHFTELPGRRVSLLLAAHAYQRPEYAALWKTLPPDLPTPEVMRTIPAHQPVLWVRQAARVER